MISIIIPAYNEERYLSGAGWSPAVQILREGIMHNNRKADPRMIGLRSFDIPRRNNRSFSAHHSIAIGREGQCKRCGSDYMRHVRGDICLRRLQQEDHEFRVRAAAQGGVV